MTQSETHRGHWGTETQSFSAEFNFIQRAAGSHGRFKAEEKHSLTFSQNNHSAGERCNIRVPQGFPERQKTQGGLPQPSEAV